MGVRRSYQTTSGNSKQDHKKRDPVSPPTCPVRSAAARWVVFVAVMFDIFSSRELNSNLKMKRKKMKKMERLTGLTLHPGCLPKCCVCLCVRRDLHRQLHMLCGRVWLDARSMLHRLGLNVSVSVAQHLTARQGVGGLRCGCRYPGQGMKVRMACEMKVRGST